MEKLCRLKPLHSGLSPAVLRDLQWAEISEAVHCQCWRTLLTELKPGHRAMLYNAMQEVTELCFFSSASSHFSNLMVYYFPSGAALSKKDIWAGCDKLDSIKHKFTFLIVVLFQQALHRDTRNTTLQLNCLLPFVPLRELMQTMSAEIISRSISVYRDIDWSPHQVHPFTLIPFLACCLTSHSYNNNSSFTKEETVCSFSFRPH